MNEKITIHFPITTCAICGERDWRHRGVLGAEGSYCTTCASVAHYHVRQLQAAHMAKCWKTGVFSLTPQWRPA